MPVTVGTTSLTYNDSTVQNSAKGVAKAWLMYRSFSDTIESSFNISSFTSIANGDFDFNFTTAMADNLYVIINSLGNIFQVIIQICGSYVIFLSEHFESAEI
jgi:hypothetical protein